MRLTHMCSLVTMISLGILTKRSIAEFLERNRLVPDSPGPAGQASEAKSLLTTAVFFA
jgi:hypothetical protein